MKERFNNFNSLGMNIDYKFKNNFVIGLDYDWFLSGTQCNSANIVAIFNDIEKHII